MCDAEVFNETLGGIRKLHFEMCLIRVFAERIRAENFRKLLITIDMVKMKSIKWQWFEL